MSNYRIKLSPEDEARLSEIASNLDMSKSEAIKLGLQLLSMYDKDELYVWFPDEWEHFNAKYRLDPENY